MTLLVVTAVEAEATAVRAGLNGNPGVTVAAVGVGPAMAAAGAARLLALTAYDGVISAGIGGGFAGRAPIGSLVVGTRAIAADLGAEDADGLFLPLDTLGFGTAAYDATLDLRLTGAARGPILTVTATTGTTATATALLSRYPDAAAEAMEGYGVACAAATAGVPFAEVRAVSNAIGPRDRSAWRIGDALAALTRAASELP